ncbi:MAG: helix-hairpin-helix domain-containing protein [Lachnospiraceae bacterium]|nr:helix-hairpin-helix domain-containing protein [Lachnospiraceae bacterium]
MIENTGRVLIFITISILVLTVPGCGSESYFETVAAEEATDTMEDTAKASGEMTEDEAKDSDEAAESWDSTTETATVLQDTDRDYDKAEEIARTIFVQVSGEVINPGVYELPVGSRIYEGILAAGGVTDKADVRRLNQAGVLSDGDMIYIYAEGELETDDGTAVYEGSGIQKEDTSTSPGITSDGMVDINHATAEELMTLPGIGESKARLIIDYRETNGGFSAPSDIMKIRGIKQGVYDNIKDRIII